MLEIEKLSIGFSAYGSGLSRRTENAIRSLDLELSEGEVLAVVGQSGAGKSLLTHALLGILPQNAVVSGKMTFKGRALTLSLIKHLRGREISLIPQSMTYLNPLSHVGSQIVRAAELSGINRLKAKKKSVETLRRYHLDKAVARQFPFQLSGGMARRILTATATIGGADLILADEPTSGLDPDTADETLQHLRELADSGKGVLMITHDIESALKIADRVSVFCAGITVEEAGAGDFNGNGKLRHPYSKALWNALPNQSFVTDLPRHSSSKKMNGGCPAAAFCDFCQPDCREFIPPMKKLNGGRVRCHNA